MRELLVILMTILGVSVVGQPLTQREKNMITEINMVRSHPSMYAYYVTKYVEYKCPTRECVYEGKRLVKILKEMKPVPILEYSGELQKASIRHGKWMKETGYFAHSRNEYAENLVGGYENTREAVIALLIDDGVPDRGHRENLLNPLYKKVSVHETPGRTAGYKWVFIQNFSW